MSAKFTDADWHSCVLCKTSEVWTGDGGKQQGQRPSGFWQLHGAEGGVTLVPVCSEALTCNLHSFHGPPLVEG